MGKAGKVIRSRDFRWDGVPVREYKRDDALFTDVVRQVVLGGGAGEAALNFETRYFEVATGGYSTLEMHAHPHAVVVLRGQGTVQLGEDSLEIAPHDCVYVAPGAAHQFRADRGEVLGFLCVVDRVRDRPAPLGAEKTRAE
jgi:mannose-6-phosphate isomerase-like protein (cupin superfamily)